MKITRRRLNAIIMNSLFNSTVLSEAAKYESVGSAKDNRGALKVSEEDKEKILKQIGAQGSSFAKNDYFIWRGANGQIGTHSFGHRGDPYTYSELGGDLYRVMSGPDNEGTYKSGRSKGRRIGARPVGATFKFTSPKPKPVPKPEFDPNTIIPGLIETIETAQFPCEDMAAQYKDRLKFAVQTIFPMGIEKGDGGRAFNDIAAYVSAARSRSAGGREGDNIPHPFLRVFYPALCPGGAAAATELYNDLADSLDELRIAGAFEGLALSKLPDGTEIGGAQTEPMSEGVSRATLYRKRYGRY